MSQELNLDSTRLPTYVRPMGDSLRLDNSVLVYGVKMVEAGKSYPTNTLYFVAEVGDSLYYRKIADERPQSAGNTTLSVRSLRALDVPKARSQYIWFEYALSGRQTLDGTIETWEEWKGHVFTFDENRGMRHLQVAPIRMEVFHDGTFYGAHQLDVSIPRAGVMEIEERLQRGSSVTKGMGWHHWLGRKIIDPSALTKPTPPADSSIRDGS